MFTTKFVLAALLQSCTNHYVKAQPIIYDGYKTDVFKYPYSVNKSADNEYVVCYSDVLATAPGDTPTTSQYLAMFSDKFVEVNNKVFAVKQRRASSGFPKEINNDVPFSDQLIGQDMIRKAPSGLYQVVENEDIGKSCVNFILVYPDNDIGQIVGSGPQFDPIEIIGVDMVNHNIYGYYEKVGFPHYDRKRTKWGHAIDGSLVAEPAEDGEYVSISGRAWWNNHPTKHGSLFNLWGDFNYARHDDVRCSGRPAAMADWSGLHAPARGVYCPGEGNNQLKKYTWHSKSSGGSTVEELSWLPAAKIARLGPKSCIYGVSTGGNLLVLWNDSGVIKSAPVFYDKAPLVKVRSVGGLDDADGHGIFASNHKGQVLNVHWRSGEWRAPMIDIDYVQWDWEDFMFFGYHGGKTYLLYGARNQKTQYTGYESYLYRLDYVGGDKRYNAELLSSGNVGAY